MTCRILAATLSLLALAAAPRSARAAEAPKKVYVIVFNFKSSPARLGGQLADSVRLALRRDKRYEVLDRLSSIDVAAHMAADTDRAKVAGMLKDELGMHMAIYGTVTRAGGAVQVDACMVSLADPKKTDHWRKQFRDDSERARGVLSGKIVEAVRKQSGWKPPEYGDEAEPKTWPDRPLNANGTFETGHAGWEPPDNAVTFIEPAPAGWKGGKVLRIRTDVERDKWLAYKRALMFGKASPAHPPTLRRDTSYGSLAGLEGVHYKSTWIKATPGQRYWLIADMKGKTAGIFFPKIFVKGFRRWSDRADGLPETSLVERNMTAKQFAALPRTRQKQLIAADARKHPKRYLRECFRWYLACRNEENVWKHYAAPCPPRGGLPDNVEWLQIQVYAYWPPGAFRFDNVHFYKDPRQKAPLAVEGARTPNFAKTSDVVERLEEMTGRMRALNDKRKKALAAGDKAGAAKCERELEEMKKQVEAFKEHYKRHQKQE